MEFPPLTSLSEADARATITAAGFKAGQVTSGSLTGLASGTVISSSPVAGDEAMAGSSVNLVVMTGTVVIVNYSGWTVQAAKDALATSDVLLAAEEAPGTPRAWAPIRPRR